MDKREVDEKVNMDKAIFYINLIVQIYGYSTLLTLFDHL